MEQKLRGWLKANKLDRLTIYKMGGVILFILSHQARAIMCIYALSHGKFRPFHFFIRRFLRAHYHIECSCKKIGTDFMLPHPNNIIIGAEEIGNCVQVNQNVTIGGNMKKIKERAWGIQKGPIIRDNVVIYTNAVVGGPVLIENHVIIGANCTCTHDVPPHTLIYNKTQVASRKINVTKGSFNYIDE